MVFASAHMAHMPHSSLQLYAHNHTLMHTHANASIHTEQTQTQAQAQAQTQTQTQTHRHKHTDSYTDTLNGDEIELTLKCDNHLLILLQYTRDLLQLVLQLALYL